MSGRNMLTLPRGDRDGENPRERFHHLLLDSLKKDRERDTKSGLPAETQQRKFTPNYYGEEAETSTRRLMAALLRTIRVVVIEREKSLVEQSRNFPYRTALIKQLVLLHNMTVAEVVSDISIRIMNIKYVSVMYGAITKPPPNGGAL